MEKGGIAMTVNEKCRIFFRKKGGVIAVDLCD